MSMTLTEPATKRLNDPDLIRRVNALRKIDNFTNWFYLIREYLFLGAVVGLTIAFYQLRGGWGLHWLWDVPVTLLAIGLVGAGQHRLSTLSHEASHYMLFRNRLLNELVSDFFCMFPMWSTTHHYRLQHLAHHQFVNDPDRDPDVSQLRASGHWLHFPVGKRQFLLTLVRQLWVPNLVRFMRVRAKYNATGTDMNPYVRRGVKQSKVAVTIGAAYLAVLAGTLAGLYSLGDPVLLAAVPAAMWVAICVVFWKLPASKFSRSRV